jgi:uncharacterized protein with GYD domain
MATYVVLGKWTEQGIRNVKEAPQRLDAARRAVEAAGGKMPAFYMVLGAYDFVGVIEGLDDDDFARVMLSVGSAGNISTSSLKAYPEDEYRRIVSSL